MRFRNHFLVIGGSIAILIGYLVVRIGQVQSDRELMQEMLIFGRMYHGYVDRNGKGPDDLTDLRPMVAQVPRLQQHVRNGEFIVVWNAKLHGGSDLMDKYLLMWEHDADKRDSMALTASGVPVRITPEYFKITPKLSESDENRRKQ